MESVFVFVVARIADIRQVFFICYSSFSIAGVHYGTGRHFKDLTQDQIHNAMEVRASGCDSGWSVGQS